MADDLHSYTFNGTDYECVINLQNGKSSIFLAPEAWDDLHLGEDLFDWTVKGSIIIKSPYDTLERPSEEARLATGLSNEQLVYKFRNDGRDTLYITIYPKNNAPNGLSVGDFDEQLWRIELELIVYDVEDLTHTNITNKMKKLYFKEKVHQLMSEKSDEFTTATVGSNAGNTDAYKLTNAQRSLKTGEAIAQLFLTDSDFAKYAKNATDPTKWDQGDEKNKIFYTSPNNYNTIDDLNYLLYLHTSSESNDFQPCIFKFERAEKKGEPKQFSLIPIKEYFKNAGKSTPGIYQIEHFFLSENSETSSLNEVNIIKAPLNNNISTSVDVKAEDFSSIDNYKLVDLVGGDYSEYLTNRFITSFNNQSGQFNIEIKEHKTEKFKEFYQKNIANQVLTKDANDRLPLTDYITKGYNTESVYSPLPLEFSRIAEGRNKLLKYYLFSNLAISFSLRGLSFRQPGRFFGLSKKTKNIEEFDNKLEGQYFVTHVDHYFTNSKRGYYTQLLGVKVHTYQEVTELPTGDVNLIG